MAEHTLYTRFGVNGHAIRITSCDGDKCKRGGGHLYLEIDHPRLPKRVTLGTVGSDRPVATLMAAGILADVLDALAGQPPGETMDNEAVDAFLEDLGLEMVREGDEWKTNTRPPQWKPDPPEGGEWH